MWEKRRTATILTALLVLPLAAPNCLHRLDLWAGRVQWDLVPVPLLGVAGFLTPRQRWRTTLLFLSTLFLFGLPREIAKSLALRHPAMVPPLTVVLYIASAATCLSWLSDIARHRRRRPSP